MIQVQGVSKKFKIYATPADRLKEKLLRRPCHHEYSALSNISFEVQPGETLGIIGENGAGKSTLLKILSGVLLPDTGSVEVTGKVTGLLELGTGFNPELTGLQNIFMNGTFLGMTHEEIEAKKVTIIEFAELGDFINEPIKTYSSGMLMRLGFAIAIHADPECFLVDEALSVGDAYFQHKCMRKINEFKEQGGSIIFVSHDTNAVKILCDSAMMLDGGRMIDYGEPKDVVDFYQGIILKRTHQGGEEVKVRKIQKEKKNLPERENNFHNIRGIETGTGEVELLSCTLLNEEGKEASYILGETKLTIICRYLVHKDLHDPHYGFIIRNSFGVSISETNTYCMGMKMPPVKNGESVEISFSMNVPLVPGDYSISLGVAENGYDRGSFEQYLFLAHDVEIIKVITNEASIYFGGVFNINPTVSIRGE